jgi:hypothetical protein
LELSNSFDDSELVHFSLEFESLSAYWLAHLLDFQKISVQTRDVYLPIGRGELQSAVLKRVWQIQMVFTLSNYRKNLLIQYQKKGEQKYNE